MPQALANLSRYDVSALTEQDLYLFNEGNHYRMDEKLGAHLMTVEGEPGVNFSVWAPNAREVSVMGSFNRWDPTAHPLLSRGSSGIWEGFVPGVAKGALYKFHIASNHEGYVSDSADPFGILHEKPPRTASVVWDLDYDWGDQDWMAARRAKNSLDAPISVYEVHIGSWMRVPEENDRPLTYREMAPRLAEYVKKLGFSHVEFFRSWSTLLRFLGIPDYRLLRPYRLAMARRRISCIWWTTCISTELA